ncbi:unnamed protein product [marine sediment metagenome]|uniref:Uncharacterized protein n=1 Tax=marine sediment metagenome TaxID=412755 RepID=X0VZG0_9ZZZZ
METVKISDIPQNVKEWIKSWKQLTIGEETENSIIISGFPELIEIILLNLHNIMIPFHDFSHNIKYLRGE